MSTLIDALKADPIAERSRLDQAAGALVAGECEACGARRWPRRAVCPECGGGRIVERPLPRVGTLLTWSRVWVAIENVAPPYVVCMIDLGGVVVFAHVRELILDPHVGDRLRLVVATGERPPYWFVPLDEGERMPIDDRG